MTTRTSPSPVDLDAPIAVTPPLGPVPAIYVPLRSTGQHTSPSVRCSVTHMIKRMAARADA